METKQDPWADELIYKPAEGIGGWLLIVLLQLVAVPFLLFSGLGLELKSLGQNLQEVKGHPAFLPLFAIAALVAVVRALFSIPCLIQLFRKRVQLPRMMQIWYALGAVAAVLTVVTFSFFPAVYVTAVSPEATPGGVGRMATLSLILSTVFFVYFRTSGRVKRTFVRGNPDHGIWRALFTPLDPSREPAGLGGWLILPLLQLVAGTLALLSVLAGQLPHAGQFAGHGAFSDLALAALVMSLVTIGLGLYTLTQFFRRRARVPALMLSWFAADILAVLCLAGMTLADRELFEKLVAQKIVLVMVRAVAAIVINGLLTWYFLRSRRVKNTFVR